MAARHGVPPGFREPLNSNRSCGGRLIRPLILIEAEASRTRLELMTARGARYFGSMNLAAKSKGPAGSLEHFHPADIVEAQRPLAPDPYDGTYKMPQGAPDARNLTRQQFHQFMHGKPQRFSKELKVAIMGVSLTAVGIGVTWLTAYIMRPDDFQWVEEERKRIQEAKERIQKKIDKANQGQ